MNKTLYLTTPIYYINGSPHLGHAYTSIIADVIARAHRLFGKDVFFLTGTDEHGQKIVEAAQKSGSPLAHFIDARAQEFKEMNTLLNISNSNFIRTSSDLHKKVVTEIITSIYSNGDIYAGTYRGLYCVGCEAYYSKDDLIDGNRCPTHQQEVRELEEDTYFFKLGKYQDKLLEYYEKNPNFILPQTRFSEIYNRVKAGLDDLSITRTSFDWGVRFPFDHKHVLYVWVDALCNYISGLDGIKTSTFARFWPPDVQIIGKDISWFHTVIWPALLLSAGISLPKQVLIHGWWTVEGDKMSKTLGNVIDPFEMSREYGSDVFRFYLMYNAHMGSDSNFSLAELKQQNNAVLANNIGNLVSRVVTLLNQYCNGTIPMITEFDPEEKKFIEIIKDNKKYVDEISSYTIRNALFDVIEKFAELNKYITDRKPWDDFKQSNKSRGEKTLAMICESIRFLSLQLDPFIPIKAQEIRKSLGTMNINLDFDFKYSAGSKVLAEKRILFAKLE